MNLINKDIEAVIFDMDGVLFDSESLHHKAWFITLLKYDIESSVEEMEPFTGIPADNVLKYFNNEKGKNLPNSVLEEQQEVLCDLVAEELNVMEYAEYALQNIKALNLPIALASSSRRRLINLCLNVSGLYKYFDVICSGQDVKKSKPEPDIFLMAARDLNIKPEKCLVIEDSISGIMGAKKAGMNVIGFTSTFEKEKLLDAGADITIDSLKEIVKYI